jgi:hypothetical protein
MRGQERLRFLPRSYTGKTILKPVTGRGIFLTNAMTTIISRKLSVLFASTLLLSIIFGLVKQGHAQPPPPCATCLQAIQDRNMCLCQGPPPDTNACPGCYTWELINHCDSCLTAIRILNKMGAPFSTCCVVVENPTHETWTQNQIDPNTVEYDAPPGHCLANYFAPPVYNTLQITTCSPASINPLASAATSRPVASFHILLGE